MAKHHMVNLRNAEKTMTESVADILGNQME